MNGDNGFNSDNDANGDNGENRSNGDSCNIGANGDLKETMMIHRLNNGPNGDNVTIAPLEPLYNRWIIIVSNGSSLASFLWISKRSATCKINMFYVHIFYCPVTESDIRNGQIYFLPIYSLSHFGFSWAVFKNVMGGGSLSAYRHERQGLSSQIRNSFFLPVDDIEQW